MSKDKRFGLRMVLCAGLLGYVAASGGMALADDFEDGDAVGWTVIEGSDWSVRGPAHGGSYALWFEGRRPGNTGTDGVVDIGQTLNEMTCWFRIDTWYGDFDYCPRYVNSSNYIWVGIRPTTSDDRPERIQLVQNGVRTVLATHAPSVTLGTWNKLQVTYDPLAGEIQVWLNDAPHVSASGAVNIGGTSAIRVHANAAIDDFDGIVTPADQIAAILTFFEAAVEAGTLEGSGPGKSAPHRLNAIRNMLMETRVLIEMQSFDEAYMQVSQALQKTDGELRPPDFIKGPAAAALAAMLEELTGSL